MFLIKMCGIVAATALTVGVYAQQPGGKTAPNVHQLDQPKATVTYASAADVAALIARAKSESTAATPMVVGKIMQLAPYTVAIEYRPKDAHMTGGTHEKEDEIFYVIQGSGTLSTGGTLTADRTGVIDGTDQKVSKGDWIFVPQGTPHVFTHVDETLVLMSLHIPGSKPAN